jgi:glycogen phosphorylase
MPLSTLRDLPGGLAALHDLALDLRWTWSHEADHLWARIDPDVWTRTRNPWFLLQEVAADRLNTLATDQAFIAELQRLIETRQAYLNSPGWFGTTDLRGNLGPVAYFSMEFGLGEALPLYAGGLGILAGDYLKTASDLGVPVTGIGLLYSEGYFRQIIDADGWQQESYPSNDPGSLPIQPARNPDGAWLQIPLDLPGRTLVLRVWQAQVGRVRLYLLDANSPLNTAVDRGITRRLYEAGVEIRLLQELVLGIAGWRVVEAVAPDTVICHMNEGHAAFTVVERALSYGRRSGLSFQEALWATRAGNVFTTHTPVEAGFDRFPATLVETYARYVNGEAGAGGLSVAELLALGRTDPNDSTGPFNMAYLAMRGAARSIGVSRQHEAVSRRIFQSLYPRWPEHEVPVGHVTNGVHVPTWDSPDADQLWTDSCGKERWRDTSITIAQQIADVTDEELWAMRGKSRQALVHHTRHRLARQLRARGNPPEAVATVEQVLDPNILTLGFARRFTGYKRPDLLLHEPLRLCRILTDPQRPVQLVLAGKAHPADDEGKRMIQEWITLAQHPELRSRLVFLEDYDIDLAAELVQGVDVWTNMPRRPWEACGTSGMKVLVNGALNLSVLDGWWEEAYDPDVGWAVGEGAAFGDVGGDVAVARDARDAAALYDILENNVVPEFYERDQAGLPRRWLSRIRSSLACLTPDYSTNRMLQEYIARLYLPAAGEFRRRAADDGTVAVALRNWELRLRSAWPQLHIGAPTVTGCGGNWEISVPIYLGNIAADEVRADLYADAQGGEPAVIIAMERGAPIAANINGHIYSATARDRSSDDYTVRITPIREGARIPAELELIFWQR